MSGNNFDIGKRIRFFREKMKMSQMALGFEAGTDASAIGKYERGEVNPTEKTLRKIINGLGFTEEEFYCDFEKEIPDVFIRRIELATKGLAPEQKEAIADSVVAIAAAFKERSDKGKKN